MKEVINECDKKLESRLDPFKKGFFEELRDKNNLFYDDVTGKISEFMRKHEIRREKKMNNLVQTSIKHYVALSMSKHLGQDIQESVTLLDEASPKILEDIQNDIKKKGQNPPQILAQEPSLNESFLEIQDELINDNHSSYSSSLHAEHSPSAHLRHKQKRAISLAALGHAPAPDLDLQLHPQIHPPMTNPLPPLPPPGKSTSESGNNRS